MRYARTIPQGVAVPLLLFVAVTHLWAVIGIGPTAATPSTILLNTPATITVTSQITDPTLLPGGINLLQIGPSGTSILGVLHDDGLNGDVTAGDGIYTLQFTATPASVGAITYEVTAAFRGVLLRVQTSTFNVNVVTGAPSITDFNPKTGPIGTLVTITGSNFSPYSGVAPQLTMSKLGGGTIAAPLSSLSNTSVSFVVPTGAATGNLAVSLGGGVAATTAQPYTLSTSTSFTVSTVPGVANLIQGQSVTYAVTLASTNGFSQLAALSVTGVPTGVTASFSPAQITAGQTSLLTLTASANQVIAANQALSVTAAATIDGIAVSQTFGATLNVVAPTTSFIGRTVVSDSLQTPLAGVTVNMLGLDGNGNTTGCTGTGMSDAAGNFVLTNLPLSCVGPQLIGYNGATVTAPSGTYAGVNIVYTLSSGQVTASPVLVHLPRIDNVETFLVQQKAPADQTYSYTTIPGLSVTVYAGTTLTLPDGTVPNPFPLAAVQVPVDRLPDLKPNVPTMVRVFIVAFQPADSTASQPVAISFPNVSNTAPGTDMPLMTLDPTHGTMVPYGTGTVSADGTQVVPDMDPSHPGHRYGLVHFDWHGQMPPPPNQSNPAPSSCMPNQSCVPPCPGQCPASDATLGQPPNGGEPVDLSSGLQIVGVTDFSLAGTRGSISIQRVYRSLTTTDGPFGIGTEMQYGWELSTGSPASAMAISLISPDGNQYLFSRQTNGTLTNSSVPSLQGVVMTTSASQATLRYPDGTVYQFQAFAGVSYLSSITDRYGNATTFVVAPMSGSTLRITQITDPVGRSLNLAYNANAHVTSITDPIGRTVAYTYNATGTLATVTDPNGGVTSYVYDSQNRMTSMTDPRGVVMFQNTFDSNGRVSQQVQADGGVIQFAYTLANPLATSSPVIATTATDPLGHQTTYRFNVQGFVTDVFDALGQTKSFVRDPGTNQLLQVTGPAQCKICGSLGEGDRSFTYDGNGNELTYTDALQNTTTFTYEPTFNQVTSVADALGNKTTYLYDSFGNLKSVTDANGHSTQFGHDSTGLLASITDPLGNTTAIGRDGLGNPNSLTDALGNITTTLFDSVSRPLLTTDPLGRRSSIVYDVLDRVTSTRDARGNTTQFTYDPVGNLLSLIDPRGNTTAFTYDSFSRTKSRTSPLGKTESWQYDLDGNAVKYTDRRGQISQFQYDTLDRLTSEQYQDGSTVARSYDPYSRTLTINDSLGGVFGFGYDLNGRLLSQSEPNGTVRYTRDVLGRVVTRQVAGQSLVTHSYDPTGNLLGSSSAATAVTYTYDARNLPKTLSRTNGVISTYGFDPLGQLLSLVHAKGSTALNTQTYSYDPSGNRISATNDLAQPLITQSASATVDQANELLTNGQTTYTQDLNGNRQTETGTGGKLTYTWDGRNRLSSITDASGDVTAFKYDSWRNLIEIDKTANGTVPAQKFVFDSLTNVVSLTDASGLPVAVLTGRSIDSHYASVDSSGNVAFGIGDALGSIGGVTSASGSVTTTASYDPYGQTGSTPSGIFPFAFTGRIPIANNVLYFRARFLDTATSRFISEDPLHFLAGSGANLYRYVLNDPLDGNDPWGLWPTGLGGKADAQNQIQQALQNQGLSPTQAATIAQDIVNEISWTDVPNAKSIANAMKGGNNIDPGQRQICEKFIQRLPAADQTPLMKILNGGG